MLVLGDTELEALVFDAFGTLFDEVSASRRHAARLGADWEAFATVWRTKQGEYTWVRSLVAGQYVDFARVVDDSLARAAAAHGIADPALLAELRDGFDHLDAFPDVAPALADLRARAMRCAILSNGTPSMLDRLTRHAGIDGLLEAVVSVHEVGVYKPDACVYARAVERLGLPTQRIGFVSSNPWDVFGAHVFGMRAIWLNRTGKPDDYRLRGVVPEVGDLGALMATLS